jgi:YfiH family protein
MAERKEPFLPEDASAPASGGPALPKGSAAASEGLTAINPAVAAMPVRPELIFPTWPAPSWVRAVCTTRRGGFGEPPFAEQNLAAHVGDDAGAVRDNRANLVQALRLEREPAWLDQVHGATVVRAEKVAERTGGPPQADACVTSKAGHACAVLVADCLPVLFCDRSGHRVGAAHAGWRGLAGGVLEATVDALGVAPASVLAWFGPAIGPEKFEVGREVRAAFVDHDLGAAECFKLIPGTDGAKYLCDIFALAKRRLRRIGVTQVHGGGICTVSDPGSFFSYRRDGRTGRMAALIWMQPGGDRR